MTSWIKASLPKKVEGRPSFFFETNDSGFCSNFNQLLYAYAYSLSESRSLEVYDYSNSVSIHLPLIKNTFGDISGVLYKDSVSINSSSIRRNIGRVMNHVLTTPISRLREIAQRIFQWNRELIPTLEGILASANLPASFDLGVHIRAGDKITTKEARAIPIDDYVRAAKKFQTTSKKDELAIFLMSDSVTAVSEFKNKADPSWKVYTLSSSLPNPEGHNQLQFNRSPPRARLAAYNAFMAEILVMQSISHSICTMSSNVGRFLYYTVEHPENLVSLDEKFVVR
jgi:hypothetical protein